MQGELGNGGPGLVYVVPPHRFCHHEGVTRSSIGDWMTHAISTLPIHDQMYGVGGATVETYSGKATIKLVNGTASQIELYYLSQPKGGTAKVNADGTEVMNVETLAEKKAPGHASAVAKDGAKKFEIDTKGKTRLFGLGLENASGAIVDNFGIVSVNVKNFATRDVENFTAELAHRNADLVMIMIGANEAQWLSPGDRATKEYGGHFEKAIEPVRKAGRACLVVSPLDQAEAKDGGYPSRPVMPKLVDAQRKAAHATGCAFYSTYDWMGGKGSAAKWFRKGMVGSDFQHLSRKGANKMADGVFEALMTGYQRYASP
jgi:lysophospholipase L1-like esterase